MPINCMLRVGKISDRWSFFGVFYYDMSHNMSFIHNIHEILLIKLNIAVLFLPLNPHNCFRPLLYPKLHFPQLKQPATGQQCLLFIFYNRDTKIVIGIGWLLVLHINIIEFKLNIFIVVTLYSVIFSNIVFWILVLLLVMLQGNTTIHIQDFR